MTSTKRLAGEARQQTTPLVLLSGVVLMVLLFMVECRGAMAEWGTWGFLVATGCCAITRPTQDVNSVVEPCLCYLVVWSCCCRVLVVLPTAFTPCCLRPCTSNTYI